MTTTNIIDRELAEAKLDRVATWGQVRERTHELTDDELVLVCGGDVHCHIHPN